MDISKIDTNFSLPSNVKKEDIVWYDAADDPFVICGAVRKDPYLRMPDEVAKAVSTGVHELCRNTAGVRARFCTDSPYIAIRCEWDKQSRMTRMAFCGICGFDLYSMSEKGRRQSYIKTFAPHISCEHGYESVLDVNGEMTDYVLNFPLYNNVSKLYIGVQQGSMFQAPMKYSNELPVVFYGSSITQGGCASRPGTCYQNFLSRALDMDYVNLGFSGCGRAEDAMIDYLASLRMSVFVSDYDHNAPSTEHLENTHKKLYRSIRAKHPDVPYIMISRPDFWNRPDDCARRSIVMKTYQTALASGDQNICYLDGASIFAGDEYDACTVDGTHPNDLGFYRFFKALLPIFEKILR
ncbi:MAG: hypothetical protein IJW55_00430 [Clostridia bacterium]|nr:hypothetical protein [Clostridia bacterium]